MAEFWKMDIDTPPHDGYSRQDLDRRFKRMADGFIARGENKMLTDEELKDIKAKNQLARRGHLIGCKCIFCQDIPRLIATLGEERGKLVDAEKSIEALRQEISQLEDYREEMRQLGMDRNLCE